MLEKTQSTGRMFLGAILILAGTLFLLRNFDFIDLNITHILFSFPSILIFVGILSFLNSSKKWFGIALIAVGGGMHLSHYYNIEFSAFILPIILIGFGFMILVKHNRTAPPHIKTEMGDAEEVWDDKFDVISIFGGSSKFINSNAFKGGNITAVFGGFEIDLSQSRLAEGENIIDVFLLFGGVTFLVPRDWDVRVSVAPIFGGFSNKIRREPGVAVDASRSLIIKGVTIFGGGEIKPVYL